MRISGGALRNRELRAPAGGAVRPTPGRVKEALFSIVGERVLAAFALDLYAGSGAVGFEALSRGADHVTFVELHRPTATAIREAAQRFGVAAQTTILCMPAEKAAARISGRFGFVYADPPYALPPPHLTFGTLRSRGAIDRESTIVYERRTDASAFVGPGFETVREASYGEVTLQFLRVV